MTRLQAYSSILSRLLRRMPAVAAVGLLVAACSCGDGECSAFCDTDNAWLYSDTLSFDLSANGAPSDQPRPIDPKTGKVLPDTASTPRIDRGDLAVVVRHSNAYPYSNLWMQIDYAGPDTVHSDTVNVKLADRFGNWHGNGMGLSYQTRETVIAEAQVDLSQPLRVRHIMRCDTLPEIEQIGIVFIPAEKARKQRASKKRQHKTKQR